MTPQVDQITCRRHAGEQRLDHVVADQRKYGPVVVGIGMHVKQPRTTARERRRERVDRRRVATLRHVRHGLERKHAPTLRPMREPTAPAYYDRRAPEYDDWYLGVGLYAERDRPGFDEELERILTTVAALPPAR